MDKKEIKNTLEILLDKIKDKAFIWRLEGSANLKIQGMDVSVQDLDITTDSRGIEIFRNALKEYIVKDFFNPKIKGHSLIGYIDGIEVEINSYKNKKLNMFDKIEKISWRGLDLPCLPLRCSKKFYELINRKKKADLISNHLNNSQ